MVSVLSFFVVCSCWMVLASADLSLDDIDEELILSLHNQIRSEQGATRMYKLIWSEKLEEHAETVIEDCEFKHSSHQAENLGAMFGFPTRNRLEAYGKSNMIKLIIRDGMPSANFKAWAQEKDNVASFDSFDCIESKVCNHYKQVVTSESRKVGCAAKYCPSILMHGERISRAWFLACDYDRGITEGVPSFELGSACTECDDDDKCQDGLCVET